VNKPTANELAEIIELRYPNSLAVEWDVVGFVTNNSNVEVNKILLTNNIDHIYFVTGDHIDKILAITNFNSITTNLALLLLITIL
jgi:hypothetical protein